MRIVCIGGGPAGLYFSLLMKKAFPSVEITVMERNRHDDTFGWGVVFSDETLASFEAADPESWQAIRESFRYWRNIEIYFKGARTVSSGHGFAALPRTQLLMILQRRCIELGVELRFEMAADDLEQFAEADLLVGSDGVKSLVRETYAQYFQPRIDWRKCKFCWLGSDKRLDAFTFIFEESEYGLFQVHAYPFEELSSTWIIECREEVWRRAGLDEASEYDTIAFCEKLFAKHLDGHRLLSNRSVWRTFPTVRCRTWHHRNVVLLGDAAHTAHFSIGSGTKLAMEDSVALVEQFREHGTGDVPTVLKSYEDARWVDILKLQKAAQTSREWFEHSVRYMDQEPIQLTFNLMTRSKRITYDELERRDPDLIDQVNDWFRVEAGAPLTSDGNAPPPIFTPFEMRGLRLENRIVVSPMCQYSAKDGTPGDWHLVHLGSRAIGGAGLVITEMTDVLPEGRITHGCAGMYAPEHVDAWRRIVDFVRSNSHAKIAMQLAHAGRKGSMHLPWEHPDSPLRPEEGSWQTVAPSPIAFLPNWPAPKKMEREDMDRVIGAFVHSAQLAEEAGFDMLELHMAHGYLLSSFVSPLSNRRRDEYGGGLENRMRFPLEVFRAVRASWPDDKPIAVRISASDWMADGSGVGPEDSVLVALYLQEAGCDLVDVSSGGNSPLSEPEYGRMYQVPFAEQIRFGAGIPVAAVGALQGADHANTVLAAGRADLAVMARAHLRDAYLTLHAAEKYSFWDQHWPDQYLAAKPRPSRPPTGRS